MHVGTCFLFYAMTSMADFKAVGVPVSAAFKVRAFFATHIDAPWGQKCKWELRYTYGKLDYKDRMEKWLPSSNFDKMCEDR